MLKGESGSRRLIAFEQTLFMYLFCLINDRAIYNKLHHEYCWAEKNEEYPKWQIEFPISNVHDSRLKHYGRYTDVLHGTMTQRGTADHKPTNNFQFPSTNGRF